jgi:hypothetical protein
MAQRQQGQQQGQQQLLKTAAQHLNLQQPWVMMCLVTALARQRNGFQAVQLLSKLQTTLVWLV